MVFSLAILNLALQNSTNHLQFLKHLEGVSNPNEIFQNIPKMETLFRKLLEKALVSSQKRIVNNFSLSAKDQYLYFKKQYSTIEQRVPQYMVASYLGITKEFLSKIKTELAKD